MTATTNIKATDPPMMALLIKVAGSFDVSAGKNNKTKQTKTINYDDAH